MRLLITGSSGLLGLNLALDATRSHQVIGVDRNTLASVPFELINTDLLDPGAAYSILAKSKPEAVIHCAALADLDSCEANPDLAYQLNADLPARLADASAASNSPYSYLDGCGLRRAERWDVHRR